jgi:type IV pilus assembly protein PilW
MINSKRAYNVQTDMAYLQENARFAMDFLSNDLRMSGYFGCTGMLPIGLIPLSGTNNNGVTNNGGLNNNGSDVLRISFMDTNRNAFAVTHCPDSAACATNPRVATPLQQGKNVLPMTNRGDIKAQDTVIASDCGGSDLYTVAKVEGNNVTLTSSLSRDYHNKNISYGAQLRRMRTHRYFVAKMRNSNGEYDYSLYRDDKALTAGLDPYTAEEVVEGVENLQLRYGIDMNTDGVPERYVTATAVTDWTRVVSVQIALLMRSTSPRNDRDPDTQTFQLDPDDADYGPVGDYRRRVLFTNTVLLRNNRLN